LHIGERAHEEYFYFERIVGGLTKPFLWDHLLICDGGYGALSHVKNILLHLHACILGGHTIEALFYHLMEHWSTTHLKEAPHLRVLFFEDVA
jgi:hypothetical protein